LKASLRYKVDKDELQALQGQLIDYTPIKKFNILHKSLEQYATVEKVFRLERTVDDIQKSLEHKAPLEFVLDKIENIADQTKITLQSYLKIQKFDEYCNQVAQKFEESKTEFENSLTPVTARFNDLNKIQRDLISCVRDNDFK